MFLLLPRPMVVRIESHPFIAHSEIVVVEMKFLPKLVTYFVVRYGSSLCN